MSRPRRRSAQDSRIVFTMLVLVVITLAHDSHRVRAVPRESMGQQAQTCGMWAVANVERDSRVPATMVPPGSGSEVPPGSGSDCRGSFNITNRTAFAGLAFGVTLAWHETERENVAPEWTLGGIFHPKSAPLLSSYIELQLETRPVSLDHNAKLAGVWRPTADTVARDLAYATVKSFAYALAALASPASCAIPADTILNVVLKIESIFVKTAKRLEAKDIKGAHAEFQQLLDGDRIASLVFDVLKEAAVNCVSLVLTGSSAAAGFVSLVRDALKDVLKQLPLMATGVLKYKSDDILSDSKLFRTDITYQRAHVPPPALVLQHTSGPPGTVVMARGEGWKPSTPISVTLDTRCVETYTPLAVISSPDAESDRDGRIDISLHIPSAASPGVHTIYASQPNGGLPCISVPVQATFTVTEPPTPVTKKVTAGAAWVPSASALGQVFQCNGSKDCVLSAMRANGASAEAVEFAASQEGKVFIGSFQPVGAIDLAGVGCTYATNFNCGYSYLIVNGTPVTVEVGWRQSSPELEAQLSADPTYKALVAPYGQSNIALRWAGEDRFDGVKATGASQQLLFSSPIKDCHACEEVGRVYVAYRFDGAGNFLGRGVDHVSASQARSAVGLTVGSWVQVTGAGDCLNFRAAPSTSARAQSCQKDGVVGQVSDGPRQADGQTWWLIKDYGWAVEQYLKPAAPSQSGTFPLRELTTEEINSCCSASGISQLRPFPGDDGLLVAIGDYVHDHQWSFAGACEALTPTSAGERLCYDFVRMSPSGSVFVRIRYYAAESDVVVMFQRFNGQWRSVAECWVGLAVAACSRPVPAGFGR